MCCRYLPVFALLFGAALLSLTDSALAQGREGRVASQAHMTRTELQQVLDRYEQLSATQVRDDELRMRARYEASLIRARLEQGDFRVGDRIALSVAGEPALTDTFVVNRNGAIDLPQIGEIALQGVLRSELDDHLDEQLSRHIRNPIVRATTTIRLSIVGAVSQPGFYAIPSEVLLTDALMEAGGPVREAQLTRVRIERGNEQIWSGNALQQAIVEGRTLDQLNLQAGDRIVVPERRNWLRTDYIYAVSLLVSLGFTLSRIF